MRWMLAAAVLMTGCKDALGVNDDTADPWQDDELDPTGDDPPRIELGEVWCTPGSQSSGDLFFVEIEAFDAQGAHTIANQGGRVAGYLADSDEEVFNDALLVCSEDRCEGSWRDGVYDPVTCAHYDAFYFRAWVMDNDGNSSEAYDLAWRD